MGFFFFFQIQAQEAGSLDIWVSTVFMISSLNRQAVQHADFSKVCVPLTARKGGLLTKTTDSNAVLPGKVSGGEKADSRCTDRVEELSRQLLEFLSVTLSLSHTHTHTHTAMQTHTRTPLPLSFLASDSRHPAMTWGVSLAASKAALNRQKYLLWQTDRPSPTTTCMQLSLSSPLLFPNPLVLTLSPL